MIVNLPREFLDEIVVHAKREVPNECCGIVVGKDGKVFKIYLTDNEENSPVKYRIPAKDIKRYGQDMIGVYHSHTHTKAYPSSTDVKLAFWPEAVYFILSLSVQEPVLRAFKIIDGQISEVDILVT